MELLHLPRILCGHELQNVLKTVPVRNPSAIVWPYDIVITHCNEPLDWLAKLPLSYRTIYLYHKGVKPWPSNKVPSVPRLEWINRENVGREGETIVHHCLRCLPGGDLFDKVKETDIVVFGQTFDLRHLETQIQLPVEKWEAYTFSRDFTANNIFPCDRNFALLPEHARNMQPQSPLSFPDFYHKMFLRPMPSNICNSYGNCFSCRVARIRRHSRAVYERLLAELSAGPNPLVGHYFERLTYSLFGAPDAEFPSMVS